MYLHTTPMPTHILRDTLKPIYIHMHTHIDIDIVTAFPFLMERVTYLVLAGEKQTRWWY